MSITYPPEMLPKADGPADVIVEARVIATDAAGNVSIVEVGGRIFVHNNAMHDAADEIERLRKIEKAARRVSEAQIRSSEQFEALEALDDALGINSPQPAAA